MSWELRVFLWWGFLRLKMEMKMWRCFDFYNQGGMCLSITCLLEALGCFLNYILLLLVYLQGQDLLINNSTSCGGKRLTEFVAVILLDDVLSSLWPRIGWLAVMWHTQQRLCRRLCFSYGCIDGFSCGCLTFEIIFLKDKEMKLQGEKTSSNKLQKYGKCGNWSVCSEKAVSIQVSRSSLSSSFSLWVCLAEGSWQGCQPA